jgi:hypothetical protein
MLFQPLELAREHMDPKHNPLIPVRILLSITTVLLLPSRAL